MKFSEMDPALDSIQWISDSKATNFAEFQILDSFTSDEIFFSFCFFCLCVNNLSQMESVHPLKVSSRPWMISISRIKHSNLLRHSFFSYENSLTLSVTPTDTATKPPQRVAEFGNLLNFSLGERKHDIPRRGQLNLI